MKRTLLGLLILISLLCGVGVYANYTKTQIDPIELNGKPANLVIAIDQYCFDEYVEPFNLVEDTNPDVVAIDCKTKGLSYFVYITGLKEGETTLTFSNGFIYNVTVTQPYFVVANGSTVKIEDTYLNSIKSFRDTTYPLNETITSVKYNNSIISGFGKKSFELSPTGDNNSFNMLKIKNSSSNFEYYIKTVNVSTANKYVSVGSDVLEASDFAGMKDINGQTLTTDSSADLVIYQPDSLIKNNQYSKVGNFTAIINDKTNNRQYFYLVKIGVPPTKLSLSRHLYGNAISEYNKGRWKGKDYIEVKIEGKDACQDVIWTSSDESIVSFDKDGNMTAHKIGDVNITCTSALNKKLHDTCHIYIDSSCRMVVGQIGSINLFADDGSKTQPTYAKDLISYNPDIIKITGEDKDILNALKPGVAHIEFFDINEDKKIATVIVSDIYYFELNKEYIYTLKDFAKMTNIKWYNIPTDKYIKNSEFNDHFIVTKDYATSGKIKTDDPYSPTFIQFEIGNNDTESLYVKYWAKFKVAPTKLTFQKHIRRNYICNVNKYGLDLEPNLTFPEGTKYNCKDIKWSSSNPEILSFELDTDIKSAKAHKCGDVWITCTSAINPKATDTCHYYIEPFNTICEGEEKTVKSFTSDDYHSYYEKWNDLVSLTPNIIKVNDNTSGNAKVEGVSEGVARLLFTVNVGYGVLEKKLYSYACYKMNGPLLLGETYDFSIKDFAGFSNENICKITEDMCINDCTLGGTFDKNTGIVKIKPTSDKHKVVLSIGDNNKESVGFTYFFNVEMPIGNTIVSINPGLLNLIKGKKETEKLNINVYPETTPVKKIKWYSNNTGVATVNEDTGEVTAVANGTTSIYAVATVIEDEEEVDIQSVTDCDITVTTAVSGVEITNAPTDPVAPKSTFTLNALISPEDATNKNVKWSSSDESVATIDDNGVVNTIKAGNVTFTVITEDGEFTDSCDVLVKIPVTGVKLNTNKLELIKWNKATLKATVLPKNASVKDVEWISTNTKVATVNSKGVVRGVGEGTAKIICRSVDNPKALATCDVTVAKVRVNIVPNKVGVRRGKSAKLTAVVTPNFDYVNKNVKWVSSNPKIATVNQRGVVTGVKKGTCKIKAVSLYDGKTYDTITVVVVNK